MASLGAAYGTLAHGVAVGVGVGVIVGVLGGVAPTVVAYGEFGLAFTVALCAGHGAGYGVADQLPDGVGSKVRIGPIYILFGIALGALADGLMGAVLSGVAFAAAYAVMYSRLITYLFDVVLAAVTGCIGWLWPGGARRAWRWCPVVWDEIIWLPLPFAGGLLTRLVRQDREEGFRQISFVAAQRPLQRRAARAALVEVALDDLRADSLMRMSNIAERLGWTTDAPVNLPSELEAALPRFDRTAQHVGQYFTLSSPYRRGEALGRAVAEAESLRRSLVAARGPYALRLLQTANEWRRLLDRENEWVKALPAAVREIPNPFIFGPPVGDSEDNVFTGRRDVVRQIEASLLGAAQAPTLLLQGPRRMGKTSILNQLPRLLGPDFAPAIVDCQNPAVTGSEATLLRYLSRALSEGLRRRRVAVEELKAQQLAREPYAVFDEWLEKVEKAMPKGMRALLCLDEYERLQAALAAGWGAPFLDSLRHTFQHRPRVVLMFTGAHTFQELGPAWTDRFISARRMRVSFLNREDVELLLTKPIPEFDMTYAAGALDALVAATNCHPFLTQAVAFELVQLMNEAQRREASAADVEEAVGRALVSGDAYFVNVWGDAGKEGQAVLRALAAGETPPDFPAARAWLREHDVIGTDGDFAVEMMRRWVASRDLKFQI
ncbi:MAG: ATP-binding protein [Acidobacteria bacterium]|nr:ATP-binding protein [Acidobacteriota bacterium]